MGIADIIFTVWLIAVIAAISEIILSSVAKLDSFVTSPRDIYDRTDLNWVTCWVLFILLRIVSPLVTLTFFVYWITHIGRKD